MPIQTRWIWHEALIEGEVWEYGRFSLYGVDILIGLACLGWLISRIFHQHQKRLSPLLTMSVSGILLVSFISLYFAADTRLALHGFIRIVEGIALFFLVSHLSIPWRIPVWTVVLSGFVQAVIAFFEFLFQSVPALKWLGIAAQDPSMSGVTVVVTEFGRFLRAYGTFPHPNIYGGFMVYVIILAVALAVMSQYKHVRTTIYGILPLLAGGLLFSFSRQSMLGLLIAMMAFPSIMAVRAKEQMKIWTISTGTLFFSTVVFALIFAPLMLTRFNVTGPLEAYSLDSRSIGIRHAIRLAQDHWLQGVGVGNYTWTLHEQLQPTPTAKHMQPVHNIYLLILNELGIFGLLFFGLFLLAIFAEGRHHPEPYVRSTHLALAGALVIIPLFLGMWDHYLWSLPVGQWIFWSMCGIAVLVTHHNPKHTPDAN